MSSGQLLIPIEYLEVPLPAACFLVRPPFWNKSAPLSTIRNFTHCWNYFTQALLVYCQTAPSVIQRAVSVSVQRDVSATNREVSGADLVPASSFLHSLFSKPSNGEHPILQGNLPTYEKGHGHKDMSTRSVTLFTTLAHHHDHHNHWGGKAFYL